MSDSCLLVIAKNADLLMNKEAFIQFLILWYGVEKHYLVILAYLQITFPSNDNAISRIKREATLKAAQASKKVKFFDDSVTAETIRIIALGDQWLIQRRKDNAETKARIKKAANIEKKEKEKANKAREKN